MTTDETRTAIDGAIRTALEYERRVRGVYADAVARATDETGKKVFEVLAEEEQGHIDYLEERLARLQETGSVEAGGLETKIPSKKAIEAGVRALGDKLEGADHGAEVELLRKALTVEEETSAFYRRMVEELPPEGQAFFRPFLAIEEGHVAVVQAEIDAVSGMGFWFDFQEFDLESG